MHKITRAHIYILLALALLFHLTIARYLAIFGIEPDLIVILVAFVAVFLGPEMGLEVGIVAGLLKDIFAFDVFGVNALALSATSYAVGVANARFFRESGVTDFFLTFALVAVSTLIHFVLSSYLLKTHTMSVIEYIFKFIVPVSLYTSIVSIPVFLKGASVFGLAAREDLL